jgi:hypothetical protein
VTRYAILDGDTVVNVIEYEQDPGDPPPGFPATFTAMLAGDAGPGWKLVNGVLVDPTPPVPSAPPVSVASATPAQFRLELEDLGKLDAVEALIAAQVREIQIRYEYATEFRSDSPLLLLLASHVTINMTEQEVYDALLRASQRNIGV